MANAKINMINRMLIKIGDKTLSSLGVDAKSQRLAEEIYDSIVDEVFALDIPYKFATSRAQLTQHADAPAFGYDYQYKLPNDCVRIIETVNVDSRLVHYEYRREVYCYTSGGRTVQDDVILCDQEYVYVKYIVKRTSPEIWPPWFRSLVILKGAIDLCPPIAQHDYRKLSLQKDLDAAMDEARAANGAEDMDVDEHGRGLDSGDRNIAEGIFSA